MTRNPQHRRAALWLALAALAGAPGLAAGETLCLQITVNDRPAGAETRLRLASGGQLTRSAQPANGILRLSDLAPGSWKLTLRHPQMKSFRTTLPVSGTTARHLDCGHADEWSGCTVKPLPGGC